MINCRQSAGKTINLEPSETKREREIIHISDISDDNLKKYLKYFREELEWSILKIERYFRKYGIESSEPSIRRRLTKYNISYKPKQKGSFYNRKHTKESKDKISKQLIGKPGPWLGKTLSFETRQKISNSQKGKKLKQSTIDKKSKWMVENNPFRGKQHSKKTKEWLSQLKTGTKLTEKQKQHLSNIFRAKNNPNYKHGKFCGGFRTDHRYSNKSYIKIKKEVLSIFNNQCSQCDECEDLQLHHIIPVRNLEIKNVDFNNKFNLIPLCLKCHQKTIFKESEFELYFQDIVRTVWRHTEDVRNEHLPQNEE